jgi:spore coat polysaccharide biosynthesis predicted glycosyltransferase SpsG
VLALLKEKPGLCEVNSHVHQREVAEDVKRVLLVADAGQEFGYGHLTRSIELALQIIEHLGYSVTFLVDDKQAATILEDLGVGVAWGSFERPAMPAPDSYSEQNVDELLMDHDLVLLDTYCQREFPSGWRQRFGNEMPVIIFDRCEQYAKEADLIIIPGVTGPSDSCEKTASTNEILNTADEKPPSILWGQDYVILRREIRKEKKLKQDKDIDILAYLHPAEQREAVERFASRNNLKAFVVHGFTSDFPQLLARARFFLSSFGYSFYEALALEAFPVAWPLSEFHHNDCLLFYRRMGLSPVVIGKEEELEATLLPILAGSEPECRAVEDGTPFIIREIAELLQKRYEVKRQ